MSTDSLDPKITEELQGLPVIGDLLDPIVTSASLSELKAYIKWMNAHGTYPVIIGGWAVYSYTRGLMSQDIDAVVYDQSAADYIIEDEYFQTNGYIPFNSGLGREYFFKNVIGSNGKPQPIRFDVFIATEKQTIENLGIVKDWSLNVQHQRQTTLGDLTMYVPLRELLIQQKIIAALERADDLKSERNLEKARWLRSKIKKDYIDVAALLKLDKLNRKLLKELIINFGVDKHMDRFLAVYRTQEHSDTLRTLQISANEIRNQLIV